MVSRKECSLFTLMSPKLKNFDLLHGMKASWNMFTLSYDEFAAPATIAMPFSVLIAVKDLGNM